MLLNDNFTWEIKTGRYKINPIELISADFKIEFLRSFFIKRSKRYSKNMTTDNSGTL